MTMTVSSLFGRRRAALRRRFARDERGVTAIEFGLLAVPFFAIVGAILETALVFLAGQVLDSAVNDASRLVRTGQASEFTIEQFQERICGRLFGLFADCDELRINVDSVGDFSSATITSPIEANCEDSCGWVLPEAYLPGGGSTVMMVRVYYKWPIMVTWPEWLLPGGFSLADLPDNTRLMGAVRVFRNEPFTSGNGET